jgi:hypothetical protein
MAGDVNLFFNDEDNEHHAELEVFYFFFIFTTKPSIYLFKAISNNLILIFIAILNRYLQYVYAK